MLILAIDTTETTASVALTSDEKLIAASTLNSGNTHSETLLPMIVSLLSSAKHQIDDIDMLAVSVGPGSFTGLRIGAATAKGLAFPFGKICVGVSSISALAENVYPFDGLVCPVINARRGQFFTGLFDFSNGKREQIIADCMMMKEEIAAEVNKYDKNVVFVGSGVSELSASISGAVMPSGISAYESAYSVALLAYRKYMAASDSERAAFTANLLNPVYLRKPQAERELEEKMNNN